MHLQLSAPGLTEDEVDMLAQDMSLDLSDSGALKAVPETRDLAQGERGVATVIGGVVIELMKTAGVAKLIEVVGAYLTQEPKMEAKITLDNGAEIVLNASNVRSKDFEATLIGLVKGAQNGPAAEGG